MITKTIQLTAQELENLQAGLEITVEGTLKGKRVILSIKAQECF